jgi:predicted dehydrogenase
MPNSVFDRRDFLKGAAATLAVLAGKRGLAASDLPTAPPPSGPVVRLGIIGLGPWGREIVACASRIPTIDLVAVCDTYAAFLTRTSQIAPKAAPVPDYRTLLDRRDVEAVVIATPSHLHKDVVVAALQAGKHVYCEVPLASTVDEARVIARASAESKLHVMAGMQGRSNALWAHVARFVKSGVLGDAAVVRAQWNRRDSWRRAAPTPERELAINWRLARVTSSGLVGEIGLHQIDLISQYLGAIPTAVSGFGATTAWRDGRDVPDTVQCVFDYPRAVRAIFTATLASSWSGAHAVFQGSSSSLLVKETRAWLVKEADSPLLGWEVYARKEHVYDETGIALIADATKILQAGEEPGRAGGVEPEKDALTLSLEAFARLVGEGGTSPCTAADAFRATAVAIRAHESTLANTRLDIPREFLTV